jgi:hypothetical protein
MSTGITAEKPSGETSESDALKPRGLERETEEEGKSRSWL